MDRLEEKLIRAASVALEGGWRITADPQGVPRHDCPDYVRSARQSIRRCPGFAPALIARAKSPGKPRIGGDQIAGRPGALSGNSGEPIEKGEIMLGGVDGIAGIGRSRPPQPGSYRRFRASCELRKVGKSALGSSDSFDVLSLTASTNSLIVVPILRGARSCCGLRRRIASSQPFALSCM